MKRQKKAGGQGSDDKYEYDYKLIIGANIFFTSDISSDISISSQSSAEGYAVAQIISSNISGKVHLQVVSGFNRNSRVYFYYRHKLQPTNEYSDWIIVGNWFLSDYTINHDSNIMDFTAVDCISYLDNAYDPPTEENATPVNHADVIQQTVSALCGVNVDIDYPGMIKYKMEQSTTSNMRTVMQNIAAYMATNYMQPLKREEPSIEYYQCGTNFYFVNDSDRESLSYSSSSETIEGVRIYTKGENIPVLQAEETLKDYGIYDYGNVAIGNMSKVFEINSPYTDETETKFNVIIGKNLGCTFSCQKVKMNDIIPCLSRIQFTGAEELYCYATSIQYDFTVGGIFANISGKGRDVSDFEYVGQTIKTIRNSPQMGNVYGTTVFDFKNGIGFKYTKKDSDKKQITRVKSSIQDNQEQTKEEYFFETNSGGFTSFDGVMSSKKEAENITVDKATGKVIITFTDGHKYIYTANVSEAADGFVIDDESEKWE